MTAAMQRSDLEDVGLLRPYLGAGGRAFVKRRNGRIELYGRPAAKLCPLLTEAQWAAADATVQRVYRIRTPIVRLIRERCGAKFQSILDPLPLPIVWCPFVGGDTIMLEAATRRVGEAVEQLHLGVRKRAECEPELRGIFGCPDSPVVAWGGDLCPRAVRRGLDRMVAEAVDRGRSGPWIVVYGDSFVAPFDCDEDGSAPLRTLREQVCDPREAGRIEAVVRADYVPADALALVAASAVRTTEALGPTLIRWEDEFRVVTVAAPCVLDGAGIVVRG